MSISICHELKIDNIQKLRDNVEKYMSENYIEFCTDDMNIFHNSYRKDIKKLMVFFDIFKKQKVLSKQNTKNNEINKNIYDSYYQNSKYSDNINLTTNHIIQKSTNLYDDMSDDVNIHDNDRTTVTLMYHENIIRILNTNKQGINTYIQFLKNITYGDYIDRIAFQKQLWIFNEMTYYLKVKENIEVVRKSPEGSNIKCPDNFEPIFTKVLTKYSTEYNNNNFVIELCKRFNITRKELYREIIEENDDLYESLTKVELNRLKNIIGLSTK